MQSASKLTTLNIKRFTILRVKKTRILVATLFRSILPRLTYPINSPLYWSCLRFTFFFISSIKRTANFFLSERSFTLCCNPCMMFGLNPRSGLMWRFQSSEGRQLGRMKKPVPFSLCVISPYAADDLGTRDKQIIVIIGSDLMKVDEDFKCFCCSSQKQWHFLDLSAPGIIVTVSSTNSVLTSLDDFFYLALKLIKFC